VIPFEKFIEFHMDFLPRKVSASMQNFDLVHVGWMAGVQFPVRAGHFLLHRVQTGFGAHQASYPLGTRGSFPGVTAAGA